MVRPHTSRARAAAIVELGRAHRPPPKSSTTSTILVVYNTSSTTLRHYNREAGYEDLEPQWDVTQQMITPGSQSRSTRARPSKTKIAVKTPCRRKTPPYLPIRAPTRFLSERRTPGIGGRGLLYTLAQRPKPLRLASSRGRNQTSAEAEADGLPAYSWACRLGCTLSKHASRRYSPRYCFLR